MLLDVSSHDETHGIIIVYHNSGPSRMVRTAAPVGISIFYHFQDLEHQGRRGGKNLRDSEWGVWGAAVL